MTSDWYPVSLALRVPWHKNFAAQAQTFGARAGLTAEQIAQAHVDAAEVVRIANYLELITEFSHAVQHYADTVLEGAEAGSMPPAPTPPPMVVPAPGAIPGIMARAQIYAAAIKGSPEYSPEVGAHFGVYSVDAPLPGTPSLVAEPLWQSEIRLLVTKGGFTDVAIDARYPDGEWEEIGVTHTPDYIDDRHPKIEGVPEVREFRAQGVANHVRTGSFSAVVSAETIP